MILTVVKDVNGIGMVFVKEDVDTKLYIKEIGSIIEKHNIKFCRTTGIGATYSTVNRRRGGFDPHSYSIFHGSSMVEQSAVNRFVKGSSPFRGALKIYGEKLCNNKL